MNFEKCWTLLAGREQGSTLIFQIWPTSLTQILCQNHPLTQGLSLQFFISIPLVTSHHKWLHVVDLLYPSAHLSRGMVAVTPILYDSTGVNASTEAQHLPARGAMTEVVHIEAHESRLWLSRHLHYHSLQEIRSFTSIVFRMIDVTSIIEFKCQVLLNKVAVLPLNKYKMS